MYCNLISATKLMANGCTISGKENVITIGKMAKSFIAITVSSKVVRATFWVLK